MEATLALLQHITSSVEMNQLQVQNLQLSLQKQERHAAGRRQETVCDPTTHHCHQTKYQSPGGHLRPSVYSRLPRYIEQYGLKAAVEVAELEFDHVEAIAALVKKENIDCDFTLTRSFDIYTDRIEAETAKKCYEELKAAGIAKSTIDDLIWTDAEQAEEVSNPLNLLST